MSSPKKILVIRLKQIGDALLSLPVCNSLRATYPNAQIDYLVYSHIEPILKNQTAIDKLQLITHAERNNKWLYFKKAHSLRKEQYDMVLDLINVPVSTLITRYCGAKHSIGFDKGRWRAKLYKTAVLHKHRGDTVTKKLDILKGLPDQATVVRDWQIPIVQADRLRIKAMLEAQGVDFKKPVVFVAASSRRTDKLWPSDYMVTALDHLQAQHNAQIIFNWVPGIEGDLVASLAVKMKQSEGVFANLDIALADLPVAISLCDFFFGNDGGPNHMAIGTLTPSLAVYAPFHLKESWLPLDSPQHQGVDINDALSLSYQELGRMRKDIKANLASYYAKITPELVMAKLDQMTNDFISK